MSATTVDICGRCGTDEPADDMCSFCGGHGVVSVYSAYDFEGCAFCPRCGGSGTEYPPRCPKCAAFRKAARAAVVSTEPKP